tara:strand:+ start:809 stop:2536 length:1728 start_codon:yes stop_codon:yes gene_type:complete
MIQQHNFSDRFLRDVLCDHPINPIRSYGLNSKAKFQADYNLKSAVNRFLSCISDAPTVMREKKTKTFNAPTKQEGVASYRWIEHNRKGYIHNLVIDIDNTFWQQKIDSGKIPMPNLIIVNPLNGYAQLVYFLKIVVKVNNKKEGYKFYKDIKEGLTRSAVGDRNFHSNVAKNPYSFQWETIAPIPYTDRFELKYFLNYIVKKKKPKPVKAPYMHKKHDLTPLDEIAEGERNSCLFSHIRTWGYSNWYEYKDGRFNDWQDACRKQIAYLNSCIAEPLKCSEARSIADSVSRWIDANYTGSGRNVRVGRFRKEMAGLTDIKDKQRLAAKLIATDKGLKTMKLIIETIDKLKVMGLKPIKENVIRHSTLTKGKVANNIYDVLFDTSAFAKRKEAEKLAAKEQARAVKEEAKRSKIEETAARIKDAVELLLAENKRVSKRSVALRAEVSMRTIYDKNYDSIFLNLLTNNSVKSNPNDDQLINNNKSRLAHIRGYLHTSIVEVEDEAGGLIIKSTENPRKHSNIFKVNPKCWSANDDYSSSPIEDPVQTVSSINVFTFDLRKTSAGMELVEVTQFRKTGT